MQVLIIADDLTGALDSAVTLADAGLGCAVARRPADVAGALEGRPDVLAVSTATRERDESAARQAVGAAFDATAGVAGPLLFKKIDSRLKGHVAAELSVVSERTGIARALVAPAIPAQGRFTVDGRLVGTGAPEPIEIAAVLAASGLDLTVPDVRSDADLDAALGRALDGPPILLAGAAGLAAALARRLAQGRRAAPVGPPAAPLMLAIGSRDPITLAQVEAVRASGWIAELPAPNGTLPERPPAQADALIVRLVPGSPALDPAEAGARFARGVAGLIGAGEIRTLLACGGETADAILGAIGVGVLAVEGAFLPGLPVSRMVVNGRPMRLFTKSGGFGGPDTLVSVVAASRRGQQGDMR